MPTVAPWAFVLAVSDLSRSAAYFRDVLGFRISWNEASDWRLASRLVQNPCGDLLHEQRGDCGRRENDSG
jgi:catechol 2,3-dioxygenase-like lactoylglutathione lyase family enzyme